MEAKELRIGNLVKNDNVVNVVNFIGFDSVELITRQSNTITARLDLIKPIPLTEEWLVKFGFELKETSIESEYKRFYKKIGDGYHVCIDKHGASLHQSIEGELEYVTCLIIKYVHQLQNLIFSLTGEELELK